MKFSKGLQISQPNLLLVTATSHKMPLTAEAFSNIKRNFFIRYFLLPLSNLLLNCIFFFRIFFLSIFYLTLLFRKEKKRKTCLIIFLLITSILYIFLWIELLANNFMDFFSSIPIYKKNFVDFFFFICCNNNEEVK